MCSDTGRARYEIRNAGVANTVLMDPVAFEGADFIVTSGDYDKLLEKVKLKNLMVIRCYSSQWSRLSNKENNRLVAGVY